MTASSSRGPRRNPATRAVRPPNSDSTIAARGVGIARVAVPVAQTHPGGHGHEDAGGAHAHVHSRQNDSCEPYIKDAAQAKLYASEVSREVATEEIQIHGGYGYTKVFPAERFYRDAKLNEIYEGTSEVLRNTIDDRLLDET